MLTDYTNTPEISNLPGDSSTSPRPVLTHAEGENRTPTSCLTRPSNVRVYQFRHFRSRVVKSRLTEMRRAVQAAPTSAYPAGLGAGEAAGAAGEAAPAGAAASACGVAEG